MMRDVRSIISIVGVIFCCVVDGKSSTTGVSKNKKPKWEPLEAAARIGGHGDHSRRESVMQISTDRRACSLYLWDAISAAKYHLCRRLLRDCIYEGRGGRRFVRIEPGSMLQLLYPLHQHSPDRCVICGGRFKDHLTLWWSRHLYTPYDLYLDKIYAQGVVTKEEPPKKRGRRKGPLKQEITYAYHRKYVFDLSELKQSWERNGRGKKSVAKLKKAIPLIEQVEVRSCGRSKQMSYLVPRIDKSKGGSLSFNLLAFARGVVLRRIDKQIEREAVENYISKLKPLL